MTERDDRKPLHLALRDLFLATDAESVDVCSADGERFVYFRFEYLKAPGDGPATPRGPDHPINRVAPSGGDSGQAAQCGAHSYDPDDSGACRGCGGQGFASHWGHTPR